MNDAVSNVKSRNILVLGAGELGMPVLRNLARRAKGIDCATISVLLREGAVESGDPSKQRDIAESYLFEPDFGVVDLEKSEVHALGSLDTAVTLTTPDDIGLLTAEIVFFEPTIRNEIVFLAGDTVTYGEVADKLEAELGRAFKRSVWTVPFLMEELANDPKNMMRKYRAAFAIGRGVS
ncbi:MULTISPECIES: Rossmann-fold NAD(P)-binding domain-containing protein [unclassified Sphingomonas]|uniref:hypothetical protein n=1 Tax=Sphingomonas sp. PvP015 TaxID=3156388 RepID=UPI003398DE7C